MLRRSIPILTIDDGDLVKNRKFKSYKYLGDPINTVKIFNEKYADEIIILDISKNKNVLPNFELIKSFANEAFMPVTYGGGVKSIDDMKKIFRLGIEKISINTEAFNNNSLIKEASKLFGSQSVICSIDYKKDIFGRLSVYINNGMTKTNVNPKDLAKKYQDLGAGEILLTTIDNEGTKSGYDFNIIDEISQEIKIPIIINGGASDYENMKYIIDKYQVAAAAGSLFTLQGLHDAVLIKYKNLSDD